ncbi:amino acid ABC transporter permease [Desulfonatronovibrio hydrogenovorans]|uniref:amino acid ABC transporter permease n=1 Tax=Desulfonatronovibrio hydrogenovorans TaxID=53245 RepID=UPI00048D50C6|nr:amino acid ABC transporter permease [Desulfonatronovibrio hydrogenovorans]
MNSQRPRITVLDIVVIALLAAAGGLLYLRIVSQLDYNWEWSLIFQYIYRYDEASGTWVPGMLARGFFTTIRLSIWATLLAIILGTIIGLFRTSRSLLQKLLGFSYVQTIRNIPPLVLIFIFYFFVSDQIMPILGVDEFFRSRSEETQKVLAFLFAPAAQFSSFLAAVITLAIYEAAYIAEIIRGGINSVNRGQWEASAALGFNRGQQMRLIILPQAFQRTLPPLAGQFISTIKDSAIVSVISIQELTFQGMELMAATYKTFEIWITITILYFSLTFTCSKIIGRLEHRLARKY